MKKLLTVLSLILIVLSLTSCHTKKSTSGFTIPETFDESKEYNIVFWSKNDSNITQKNIYIKAVEDFEKIYPTIHVDLKTYTDYNSIYNDVIKNISTNTTPNVCITYPDHVATYNEGDNVIIDLDNLINDSKYGLGGSEIKFDSPSKTDMIETFMDECKIDGVTYCIPFMRSSEALYINKDYVESLGYTIPDVVTWDFMFEVSSRAMELKDEDDVLIPIIYKSTDNMMIQMLDQLGAGYSDSDGNIYMFNDSTKEILKDLYQEAYDKTFSTFKISSYPGNYLNKGECIFAIDSTAGATWMGSDCPLLDIDESEVVQFETVVKPVPQYNTDDISMISQGPSLCIFNKEDSDEVLASWIFVEYLLTNDVQIAYSKTEGYVPVTNKAINSSEYQDYLSKEGLDNDEYYSVKIQASKMLLSNIDKTFTTPVYNGSTNLRNAAGNLIEEVCKKARKDKAYKRDPIITDDDIETIFNNNISLYELNISSGDTSENNKRGKMPTASIILLSSLLAIWIGIGITFVYKRIKKI